MGHWEKQCWYTQASGNGRCLSSTLPSGDCQSSCQLAAADWAFLAKRETQEAWENVLKQCKDTWIPAYRRQGQKNQANTIPNTIIRKFILLGGLNYCFWFLALNSTPQQSTPIKCIMRDSTSRRSSDQSHYRGMIGHLAFQKLLIKMQHTLKNVFEVWSLLLSWGKNFFWCYSHNL